MFGKDGEAINHLEVEFGRVESTVLHTIRQVSSSSAEKPNTRRSSVCSLYISSGHRRSATQR
jgi:hypothetical protein